MTQPTRIPLTEFASAPRVSVEIIRRQAAGFQKPPAVLGELEAAQAYVFVLNRQRQIVFASRNLRELIPDKVRSQLLGMRPGEALRCIRAHESESGCGGSDECLRCGALQAIVASLTGRTDAQEFTLTRFIGCHQEVRPFLALATPLVQGDETFSIFAVTDKSNTRAREILARPPVSNPPSSPRA